MPTSEIDAILEAYMDMARRGIPDGGAGKPILAAFDGIRESARPSFPLASLIALAADAVQSLGYNNVRPFVEAVHLAWRAALGDIRYRAALLLSDRLPRFAADVPDLDLAPVEAALEGVASAAEPGKYLRSLRKRVDKLIEAAEALPDVPISEVLRAHAKQIARTADMLSA